MITVRDGFVSAFRTSADFAVAACLDPQNAETVLLIVVGDALDESRQHLPGR